MASVDCILSNNQVSFDRFDYRFKCDFCPSTFQTEDTFNTHCLEHFEKKQCSNCTKFVIRIGCNWYELHQDESDETDSNDNKDHLVLESITEVKVEETDEVLEFNDSNDVDPKSSDDLDFIFSDSPSAESDDTDEYSAKTHRSSQQKRPSRVKKPTKNGQKKRESSTQKTDSGQAKRKGPLPRIVCRICERIILKYNFDTHLLKMHVPNVIVTKERIKCETCGKFFANPGSLKTHQAIHSETRRFVCSYCGASFRALYHLTEHTNAHTGEKPYHCTICDKRFGRLHILTAHQRVHTGEKPHVCSIDGCDRAYAYDIDLKRHKFSAHGIYTKKHTCSFCSKVFPENKLLKKHLESHSAGNIRGLTAKANDQ